MARMVGAFGVIVILAIWAGSASTQQDTLQQQAGQNRPAEQAGPSDSDSISTGQQQRSAESTDLAAIERGEYLVLHVAMCVMCHSERDSQGNLVETRILEGGKIPIRSPYPDQQWGFRAPAIKGLPGWEEDEIVLLLTTGRTSSGWSPRPPMPPYRMTEEDAAAIVSYLKAL